MTTIFLKMCDTVYGTRDADPEYEWSQEDTSTDWSFEAVSIVKTKFDSYYDTDFDVSVGDKVFLVVAVWSTGDSFSNCVGGRAEIFGAFKTEDEAECRKIELERATNGFPWFGYFEALDYVEVIERIVK